MENEAALLEEAKDTCDEQRPEVVRNEMIDS